ncbi:MAG: YggS family pyridoxal phosphate-dependent enzyme [Emcibacter sp.]|nr:YggS family pyridoxal phosphate-dependent enzyme [Emcibacter sp.]
MTSKLDAILQNIEAMARRAKRNTEDITLIAVSKTKSIQDIIPLLNQGHRVFGENKIQEAQDKWPLLRQDYTAIELHLIGPLQSNKVRQAIQTFDVIETVDRPKIARAIARISQEEQKICPCYIQINVGCEDQKAGIDPNQADAFIKLCRDELKLPIVGLMCIPPADQDPKEYFLLLKEIADRNQLAKLSMGMSGDYALAIECGATSVRIGTALFGER